VREIGEANSFIGHIGGDDFVFVAEDHLADEICQKIIENFDKKVPSFYTKEDYDRGHIIAKDRQGNEQKFGLLAISIGVVSTKRQNVTHVAQIGEIAAELKKYAKMTEGSSFVRDKRTI
jgi:GGDEF domain-containing protein